MRELRIIQAELDRRAAEIERLTAEVERYRAAGAALVPDAADRLAMAFDLTPRAAEFLGLLYDAMGHMVPNTVFRSTSKQSVRSLMSWLRKSLGDDAIMTINGRGYMLSPAGMAKCDAVLAA